MGAFIEAENVRKTYRVGKIEVRACAASPSRCDEVSLSAGPSGSGKSTLFYIIGGLTRADSSRIVIDGDDLSQLSDVQLTDMRSTTSDLCSRDSTSCPRWMLARIF